MIIITADDYGKNVSTTENIVSCAKSGRLSAASAMVFMEDSERAAFISRELSLEVGLHLNFTTPLTKKNIDTSLIASQKRLIRYLGRGNIGTILFNPFILRDIKNVYSAQKNEFIRIFEKEPSFINGHHHMHLCMNMLMSNLIPESTLIRRTYTFESGEKNFFNLAYRRLVNLLIDARYISSDKFLSIEPISNEKRLKRIFELSKKENIEIEVHPEKNDECAFLLSDDFGKLLHDVQVGYFRDLASFEIENEYKPTNA